MTLITSPRRPFLSFSVVIPVPELDLGGNTLVAVTASPQLNADVPLVPVPKPEALKSRRARLEGTGETLPKNPKCPQRLYYFMHKDRDAPNHTCAAILFYMLILNNSKASKARQYKHY